MINMLTHSYVKNDIIITVSLLLCYTVLVYPSCRRIIPFFSLQVVTASAGICGAVFGLVAEHAGLIFHLALLADASFHFPCGLFLLIFSL